MSGNQPTSHASITLQKPKNVSCGLDWISATYSNHANVPQQLMMPQHEGDGTTVKARNGYTIAKRYASGATLMSNPDSPRMGYHVTYTSQAIRATQEEFGMPQDELLSFLSAAAKIVRLDVRVDAEGFAVPIHDMYLSAKRGGVETRSRSISYVESAKAGNERGAATCYIGSQTKRKKLLRVYDKGAQLNLENYITRFELETRGDVAMNAARHLKQAKLNEYGDIIRGMIRDFAHFTEIADCVEIFSDATPIRVNVPAHVTGNTEQWLYNQCAPALAREMFHDSSVLAKFMSCVADELRSLEEKGAG